MKRTIGFSAGILAASLIATGCSGNNGSQDTETKCEPQVSDSALVNPGKLTYSTNATLPPVQYVENGEVAGMRIELVDELAARLCLEAEAKNVPFETQIPGLQGDRWDLINTGLFYTEERAKTIALIPYESQGAAVSVLKDNELEISAVEDLAGLTIGVEAPGYEFDSLNAINDELKAKGLDPITVNTSLTNADAFQALSAGQLDGVVTVEAVTTYYQSDNRFATGIDGLHPGPLALGIKKGNTELSDAVSKAYTEMFDDGFVKELFDSYDVTPFPGPFKVTTGPVELEEKE